MAITLVSVLLLVVVLADSMGVIAGSMGVIAGSIADSMGVIVDDMLLLFVVNSSIIVVIVDS